MKVLASDRETISNALRAYLAIEGLDGAERSRATEALDRLSQVDPETTAQHAQWLYERGYRWVIVEGVTYVFNALRTSASVCVHDENPDLAILKAREAFETRGV